MGITRYPQVDVLPFSAGWGNSAAAAAGAPGVETATRFGLSEFVGVSGQLWVNYFTPLVDSTVTQLMMASAGTAGSGQTLDRMAIFSVAADDSITLVARTASDVAIGGSTYTPYERVLATAGGYPSSYTFYAGVRYAMGFLETATTATKLQGSFSVAGSVPPVPCRIITGQTDILTSYAVASLPSTFTIMYMRGRP